MFSQGKAPGHSPSTSAHNPPPSPSTALETELVNNGGEGEEWTVFPDSTNLLQTGGSMRDEITKGPCNDLLN